MAEKRRYNTARILQPKLEYEGYSFHHNGSYGDTRYYECSFRKNKDVQCRARLKIENGKFIVKGVHKGHEKPVLELIDLKKEIEASEAFETTRMIKKRILSKHDHLLDLTTIGNVEKSIERHKKQNLGQSPNDLNDLHDCLKKENWKQLLMIDETDAFIVEFDIKNNDTKAVIFIDKTLTELIINLTREELIIFVDGTFATVPRLKNNNCQLWTILIRHNDRTFPIVYTIMKGRNTENYTDVLMKVTSVLKIRPDTVMSDFEKAERKALKTVFPHAKIIGCFFHYSQALVDNADKHGILKGEEKESGWGAIKLFICLALLPEKLIEEGFQVITNVIFNNCKHLEPFIKYYRETWINGFKSGSFCVFKQTHRTNNVSERHNRELQESLKKHSTIVEFLAYLTEHQKNIRNFARHPKFWARMERNNLKQRKNEFKKIWEEIEANMDNLDILLILNKLSKLIGKREINK